MPVLALRCVWGVRCEGGGVQVGELPRSAQGCPKSAQGSAREPKVVQKGEKHEKNVIFGVPLKFDRGPKFGPPRNHQGVDFSCFLGVQNWTPFFTTSGNPVPNPPDFWSGGSKRGSKKGSKSGHFGPFWGHFWGTLKNGVLFWTPPDRVRFGCAR